MTIRQALLGWSLVRARITYYMPDHPHVINPNWFLWETTDRTPDFPAFNQYLKWWEQNLDGKLHSVIVSVKGLIEERELRHFTEEFRLS